MKSTRGLIAAGILVASCGLEPGDADIGAEDGIDRVQSAIIGGTATTARPEVAEVEHGDPFNPDRTCTATMIDDRHFVTAAGCFDYAPFWRREPNGSRRASLTFSPSNAIVPIERVFSQGGQRGADDIAVGSIEAHDVSFTPAIISSVPPAHEWLTVMGYGCTAPGLSFGETKRYREYAFNGGWSDTTCTGDGGGPVFHGRLAANGTMVRINSGRSGGKDVHADPYASATRS